MDVDQMRLAFFKLRYGMEKTAAAVKAFSDAYWESVRQEQARLRAHRRAAAREVEIRRREMEAEYQAWKKQQENTSP